MSAKSNEKRLHETDSESDIETEGAKKTKCQSKPRVKYQSKWRSDWKSYFPSFRQSMRGDNFADCTVCIKDINISHGGKHDLTKHSISESHKSNENSKKQLGSVAKFMQSTQAASVGDLQLETTFLFGRLMLWSAMILFP